MRSSFPTIPALKIENLVRDDERPTTASLLCSPGSSSSSTAGAVTWTDLAHALYLKFTSPTRNGSSDAATTTESNPAHVLSALLENSKLVPPPHSQQLLPTNCPSVGSILHEIGICKACVFANKAMKTCRNGHLCVFCHQPHKDRRNKKRQVPLKTARTISRTTNYKRNGGNGAHTTRVLPSVNSHDVHGGGERNSSPMHWRRDPLLSTESPSVAMLCPKSFNENKFDGTNGSSASSSSSFNYFTGGASSSDSTEGTTPMNDLIIEGLLDAIYNEDSSISLLLKYFINH